jgi:hypothetical protein
MGMREDGKRTNDTRIANPVLGLKSDGNITTIRALIYRIQSFLE